MNRDSSWTAFLMLIVDALISDYFKLNMWLTILLIITSVVLVGNIDDSF